MAEDTGAPGSIVCLRCGGFAAPGELPVRGVALCRACLSADASGTDPIIVFPPRRVFWMRIWPILIFMSVGLALGIVFGELVARPFIEHVLTIGRSSPVGADGAIVLLFADVLCPLLGLLGGEIVGIVLFFSRAQRVGNAEWKRALIDRLGLKLVERDADRFQFVIYAARPLSIWDFRIPVEVGLLAEGEGGLAFLGARGTRLAVPVAAMRAVSVERMKMLPPRSGLKVERGGETACSFAFLDKGSFAANKREAELAAERLRARMRS